MAGSIAGAMGQLTTRMFGAPATAPAAAPAMPPNPAGPAMPPSPAAPSATGLMPQGSPVAAAMDTSAGTLANRYASQDSPLIQQARAAGEQHANARGLLNSSMSAGASEAEAMKVAVPLATADSQTYASERIAGQNNRTQLAQTGMQTASQERISSADITAQKDRLLTATSAQMAQLEKQLASAEGQQRTDIQAQMDRLKESSAAQIAQIEKSGQVQGGLQAQQGLIQGGLQAQQNQAEMARLQASLANATDQQKVEIAAQMDRLIYGTNASQVQQDRDIAAKELMQKAEFANLNEQQKNDLASRMSLLTTQLASQSSLQTQSLDAAAKQQQVQIEAQELMQSAEFSHLDGQQKNEIAASMARLVVSGQQSIAQIGASGEQDRARVELEGKINSAMQATGADQQRQLASLQGDIASRLQGQQDSGQMARLTAQFQHDTQVQDKDNAAKLKLIAASGDQNMRQLVEQGLQERETLSMNLASNDRQAIASSMVNVFQSEAALRSALLGNTTMPAAERSGYDQAISSLGNPLRAFIAGLYSAPAGGAAPGSPQPTTTPPVTSPATGSPGGPIAGGSLGGGMVQNPGLGEYLGGNFAASGSSYTPEPLSPSYSPAPSYTTEPLPTQPAVGPGLPAPGGVDSGTQPPGLANDDLMNFLQQRLAGRQALQ